MYEKRPFLLLTFTVTGIYDYLLAKWFWHVHLPFNSLFSLIQI